MTKRLAGFLRQTVPALLLVSAVLMSGNVQAEDGYFKWTDPDGRTHLGDRPPPAGTDYEFVSADTGVRRAVSAEDSASSSAAPAMPQPAPPEQALAQQQITIEKNPEYCEQAKGNIDTLDSVARIRIRDNDGEMRFLTEDEKSVQRQKAVDMIAVHCK